MMVPNLQQDDISDVPSMEVRVESRILVVVMTLLR